MRSQWQCARQAFGQRHYWAAELGPLVCIGLSTVRFRSNEFRRAPLLHQPVQRRMQACNKHSQDRQTECLGSEDVPQPW